ncbi:MAG: GDSL family lipase [Clostridia bacterium]|nr:GDSL family lipase [Clostridia bacterium]
MVKKILLALIILVVAATAVGGVVHFSSLDKSKEGPVIVEFVKSSFKRFAPSDEFVKPIGRTHYSDEKRYISMSGSGIEFFCKGSYAYITVIGDGVQEQSRNSHARFAIYKNNELIIDDTVSFEKKKYHIDINDFENGAVIRLVKLSEAKCSGFYIGDIGAFCTGDIEPTAEKEIKIEFIGDSITCGYGIDAGAVGEFSTHTENFTKTYAYLTAQSLDADYSVVAFSGYGMLSGYTGDGTINIEGRVGKYYDKSALYHNGGKALWDFSDFTADFVVINLGTNDASYCFTRERCLRFKESYLDFIISVRRRYPEAYIFCVLGDMNNSLYPLIEQAAEEFRISESDYRIKALTLDFKMGENEIVIDGHPGADSNALAAETLVSEIKKVIDYGY